MLNQGHIYMQQEHIRDLLREAKARDLARRARAEQPARPPMGRMLTFLSTLLLVIHSLGKVRPQ